MRLFVPGKRRQRPVGQPGHSDPMPPMPPSFSRVERQGKAAPEGISGVGWRVGCGGGPQLP